MTSSLNNYDMPQQFQRNSNIYWTLQPRQRTANERIMQTQQDPYQNAQQNIESLYSTPHKNRNNLKTTALGFDFFSPVPNTKLNERIVEEIDDEAQMSPLDPRNGGQFITSTPTQKLTNNNINMSPMKSSLTEDLRARLRMSGQSGIRSMGNSPINSGRSTPSKLVFEPQTRSRHSWSTNNVEVPSTTCSDRLGTPKTSLMDFKKLLLTKTSSQPRGKISAVELLKMGKTNVQKPTSPVTVGGTSSPLNILDLSGSPKTFATRRMIRQGQFGSLGGNSNSPTKPNLSGKQKQAWRLQAPRTDVISHAIPEAVNDEEQQQQESPQPKKNQNPFDQTKSPEIVIKDVAEVEREIESELVGNFRQNLFIKQDENNFTENEIRDAKKSAHLQQRNQFLFGLNQQQSASASSVSDSIAVFKNGGIKQAEKEALKPGSLPASLETAL